MIVINKLKQCKGKVVVHEKKVKPKKTNIKVVKINKKWFVTNFNNITKKLNIKLFGIESTSPVEIYRLYLNEKKKEFNILLYENINSIFLENNNIKRPVELI